MTKPLTAKAAWTPISAPARRRLAQMPREDCAASQRRQRKERGGDRAERGGALCDPARRPAQREDEAQEAADAEEAMQRPERPSDRPGCRSGWRAQMQNRKRAAQQHGEPDNHESRDQHERHRKGRTVYQP